MKISIQQIMISNDKIKKCNIYEKVLPNNNGNVNIKNINTTSINNINFRQNLCISPNTIIINSKRILVNTRNLSEQEFAKRTGNIISEIKRNPIFENVRKHVTFFDISEYNLSLFEKIIKYADTLGVKDWDLYVLYNITDTDNTETVKARTDVIDMLIQKGLTKIDKVRLNSCKIIYCADTAERAKAIIDIADKIVTENLIRIKSVKKELVSIIAPYQPDTDSVTAKINVIDNIIKKNLLKIESVRQKLGEIICCTGTDDVAKSKNDVIDTITENDLLKIKSVQQKLGEIICCTRTDDVAKSKNDVIKLLTEKNLIKNRNLQQKLGYIIFYTREDRRVEAIKSFTNWYLDKHKLKDDLSIKNSLGTIIYMLIMISKPEELIEKICNSNKIVTGEYILTLLKQKYW